MPTIIIQGMMEFPQGIHRQRDRRRYRVSLVSAVITTIITISAAAEVLYRIQHQQ
jgi:hypothetical protein